MLGIVVVLLRIFFGLLLYMCVRVFFFINKSKENIPIV